MIGKLDPEALAAAEVAWFDKYNRRDWGGLAEAIRVLRREQFGVEISDAAVEAMVDVGRLYIIYKERLADGDEIGARARLSDVERLMAMHYQGINDALSAKFGAAYVKAFAGGGKR